MSSIEVLEANTAPCRACHLPCAGYDFTDALNAYVGVDNVTNKEPPLGLIGSTSATSPTTAQSSIYNVRGRFFFAGAKYKL